MASNTPSTYAPPPDSPPARAPAFTDHRPPLIPISSKIDLSALATRGWLTIPLDEYPELRDAYVNLFSVSTLFFDLPDTDEQKTAFAAASGAQASEEGYSHITGEKQILTCRSAQRSPSSVCDGVTRAWAATGQLMENTTRDIARSLGLPAEAYDAFVTPCAKFPTEENTPTLLRMFRYDRPLAGAEKRVVAEPHRDLGMLSLVIGHTPGLDVLEPPSPENPQGKWISIEEPDTPGVTAGGLTATLLSGQVLNFLSQGRYNPGVHRVSVRPTETTPFRFSLVFALRPFPAPVHTALLESPQVGAFHPNVQMRGESMSVLFARIVKSHWNINVEHQLRNKQRENLEKGYREKQQGQEDVEIHDVAAEPKTSLKGKVGRLFGRNWQ